MIGFLNNLLEQQLPPGGRYIGIGEALVDGLIGFAVVFLGIAILVGVVWLIGFIMKKFDEKKAATTAAIVKTEEKAAPVAISEEDDEELVAVITAAIAAVYEKEGAKCEFVVRKIKRI